VARTAHECGGQAHRSGRGRRATLDASSACAIRKDYLHCELSLGKATNFCTKRMPGIPARRRRFETETNQDSIVNSRIALRNAKALAGSRAFACAVPLLMRGLPDAPSYEHRESEDRFRPGGGRV